ncbi:MAG: aspartate kinase [Phycisphaeraceae bacterium]|nr:aspartate kinase [Phycisphaeraceae bacterium]
MPTKVAKFGGTSLASAPQIRKMQAIVQADDDRRFVVPSAPGKRDGKDTKITDLLYLCHDLASKGLKFDDAWDPICERFKQIVSELGLSLDLEPILAEAEATIAEHGKRGLLADYAASRGEAINGRIIAELLQCDFVDPTELIFFSDNGRLDEDKTYATISERLGGVERAIVPGFFGLGPDGNVKTFSRGGSDVTGAIVARGVNATVYENWTDVHGLLITDPRIVPGAFTIETVTYRELRELSYSGASVLHDEAVFPVRQANIPVNIRNTNDPEHPGTLIVSNDHESAKQSYQITGIAGRKDFTIIQIEKAMMNSEIGFGKRVLGVLADFGVSFEHIPSGIDTLSVVIEDTALEGKLDDIIAALQAAVKPDNIDIDNNLALIATVGRGMAKQTGTSAKLFSALGEANVNIRMIDQGSSEMNIIVGTDVQDFEKAVKAIYAAFISEDSRPRALS